MGELPHIIHRIARDSTNSRTSRSQPFTVSSNHSFRLNEISKDTSVASCVGQISREAVELILGELPHIIHRIARDSTNSLTSRSQPYTVSSAIVSSSNQFSKWMTVALFVSKISHETVGLVWESCYTTYPIRARFHHHPPEKTIIGAVRRLTNIISLML